MFMGRRTMNTKASATLCIIWLLASTVIASLLSSPTYAYAGYDGSEYPYTTLVSETGDYFVVIEVPSAFTAETDLCDNTTSFWCAAPQQGGNFTDSALWLYDANGGLLTSNDDDPRTNGQSYQSYISVTLEAGVYRLRAGRFTCRDGSCMWPQDPFPEGGHYQLLTTTALLLDPNPPTVVPTAIPSILPTPEPTPEPSVEPTPEPTPTQAPETPTPSPSVAPSPTPEPSTTPPPTPEPTPEPPPTPEPTPEPTPTPTEPPPTVAPTQEPTNEPPPNPTATPEPTPEGTVEPSIPPSVPPSPDPTAVPPPEPTQPPLPSLEEVAAAVDQAVEEAVAAIGDAVDAVGDTASAAVEAVSETVSAAVDTVANLGNEITEEQREEARATVVPAIIMTQIATAVRAMAQGGGGFSGGDGGKPKRPSGPKNSSRPAAKTQTSTSSKLKQKVDKFSK